MKGNVGDRARCTQTHSLGTPKAGQTGTITGPGDNSAWSYGGEDEETRATRLEAYAAEQTMIRWDGHPWAWNHEDGTFELL